MKGYEIEKGRYVVVERGARGAAPKASHTIEIEDFVDLDEIDPLYFEYPYYLVPDEKAAKPYKLLVEAMTELQKVAIGRIVILRRRSGSSRSVRSTACSASRRCATPTRSSRSRTSRSPTTTSS